MPNQQKSISFDARKLSLRDTSYLLRFFERERIFLYNYARKHNITYPKLPALHVEDYGLLIVRDEEGPDSYIPIESLSIPLKKLVNSDDITNLHNHFFRTLRQKFFTINDWNTEKVWVDSVLLDKLISDTLSHLPPPAVKQMESMSKNPTQAFENSVPQTNQQIHAATMSSQPILTPMTVEHLPQLATQLPPQQIPTLLNAPIHDTISFGMPTETRTAYLPPEGMAYGGVLEDLKDLALGSYQVNEIINVPVNTQQGTILFRKKYGLDMLGGYAKRWVNLHKRYTGPITFRVRIVSTSIVQGNIRIGWNLGDDTIINIDNSSKFGAVDFDLSQPNNEFDFTIQPIAESTGRFFFTTDEEPKDQGFIYAMLLTPITNNFSDLGSIQMIVESRLHPNFCLSDPLDVDVDAVGLSAELDGILNNKDLNLKNSTVYIETRKYPKYPVGLPGSETVRELQLKSRNPITKRIDQDTTYGPMFQIDNLSANFFSDIYLDNNGASPKEYRSTYVSFPEPKCNLFGADAKARPVEGPLLVSYGVIKRDDKLTSIQSVNFDVSEFSNDLLQNLTTDFSNDLSTAVISTTLVDEELDANTLPNGYYTVEIGPTILPSLSAAAAAQNFNVVPRSDAGWVLYNYCNINCPAGGQVKISLLDKIFNTTQCEFLYRKEIGFFTSATEAQRFSFLDSTLDSFIIKVAIFNDRSNVVLRNDLPSFNPMTNPTRRFRKQMFSILGAAGGLLGGLGQGLMQNSQNNFEHSMQDDRLQNNMDLQGMRGDQALAQINASGNMSLLNTQQQGQNSVANITTQGIQNRKTMQAEFGLNNAGNNLFRSPMNRAANHVSPLSKQADYTNGALSSATVDTRNLPNRDYRPTRFVGTPQSVNRTGVMPISGTGRSVSSC